MSTAVSLNEQLKTSFAQKDTGPGPLLLHEILNKARNRWLSVAEINDFFNFAVDYLHPSTEPPQKPPLGGELYLYSRTECRHFRKDGHAWPRRVGGRTLHESHERFKVPGQPGTMVSIYYGTTCDGALHRRVFWRIQPAAGELPQDDVEVDKGAQRGQGTGRRPRWYGLCTADDREDLVLVHYLGADDARASALAQSSRNKRNRVSSVSEGALRLAALAGAAPAVTVSTSAGQGTTTETLSAPAPRQASSLQRGMQSLTMNPTTSTASAGAVQSAPRQHARSSSQVFSGQVASCFPHHSTVPTAETSTQQQDAGAIRPQQGQGEGRGQGVCVPVGPEVAQGQGGVSGSVRASKRLCSQPTLSSAMPERGSGASAGAAAAHGHGIVIGGAQAVPVCEHSHSVGSLPVFLAADTRSDVVIGGMHNAVSFQRMPQHPQHGQGAVELASNHHGSYQLPCEWPGMPSNSQGRGQHRVPVTPGTSCTAHANGAGVEGDDYLSYMLECMSDMDGQIGGEPGETGMSAQAPQFTGCAAPVPMLFPFGAAGVCNPAPATNGWPLAHGCGSLSTAVPPQRAVLPIPTTPSTVGHATPSQAGSCGAMCQQPQIRNLADYIGAPLDSRPVSFSASRPDSTGQNSRPPSGATARSSTCFGPPCAAAPEMMPTATFGSLGGDVTSAGGEIGRFRGLQPTGSALSMGQQVRPYGPDHTSAPNGICGVGATGPVRSDYNVAGHAFASGGSALANRLQLPASTGLRSSLLSHTEHLVQAAEARRSAAGADREEPDPVKRMMRMPSNFVTNTAVQQGQASSVLMHQSMRVQVPAPPGFVDMSSGGGGLPLGGAGQDGGWAAPAAGSTCYPPQSATVTNLRLMLADRLAQIQAEGAAARSRNSVPTSGSAVSSLNVSAHSCSRSASNRQGSGSSTVQMMSSANVSGNYSSSHTVTTHHRLSGAESSGAGSLRQVVTLESLAECDISAGMFW